MRFGPTSQPRWWGGRLPAALIGVGLALVLAELFCRGYVYVERTAGYEDDLRRSQGSLDKRAPDVESTQESMIRPHSSERVAYELKPHLDVLFKGVRVRTNSYGFRGAEPELNKAPGSVRIVILGDSMVFGWGVPEEQACWAYLQRGLERSYPEKRWEVLSFAVPGYNTVMEVETLKLKALQFDPDVVILGWCGNDFNLPNFIGGPKVTTLRRSFLRGALRDGLRSIALQGAPLRKGDRAYQGFPGFERDPEFVPQRYHHLIGETSVRRALGELIAMRDDHGFELITYPAGFPDTQEQCEPLIQELKDKHHVPIVFTTPRLQGFLERKGIEEYRRLDFMTAPDDAHPNSLRNELIGESMLATLEESGILSRCLASSSD